MTRYPRPADDRGSIALYFAIITVAALAMAGLVIDGGAALAARETAADLATQAARAGANALAPTGLHTAPGVDLHIDPTSATAAAQRVLTAGGATGRITIDGTTVRVQARLVRRTVLLSAVGLTQVTETATATASPLYGGQQQEGG